MWWFIAFIVSAGLSYAFAPKPTTPESMEPGDVETPEMGEGSEIPVLFGTRDVGDASVVWYGDIKTVAVKKSTGGKK